LLLHLFVTRIKKNAAAAAHSAKKLLKIVNSDEVLGRMQIKNRYQARND
jgi:hypothetical protein